MRIFPGDGHIPCFHAEGDHWSFAKLDNDGKVIEVREKMRISDNCTLGAYYFSSAKLYKDLYQEYYVDDSHMEKNEKYIAPLYNYMIEKGMDVTISIVDADKSSCSWDTGRTTNFLEGKDVKKVAYMTVNRVNNIWKIFQKKYKNMSLPVKAGFWFIHLQFYATWILHMITDTRPYCSFR